LWIPGLWVFVISTRPVNYWFNLVGIRTGGTSGDAGESSLINTAVYLILTGAAIVVLLKRNFEWGTLFRNNAALMLVYCFFAVSALWTGDGLVSFRRLFKDFGNVLVALVILSETRPWDQIRTLLVRLAYIHIPLSFICCKFFPYVGRNSSRSDHTMYTGLTMQKNTLGQVMVLLLLVLIWDYFEISKELSGRELRRARAARLALMFIGLWTLNIAASTTATILLMLGAFLFFLFKRALDRGQKIVGRVLVLILLIVTLESTLNLSSAIYALFGKNETLTGRTDIWNEALRLMDQPILGFGYYQFWFTPKADLLYRNLGDLIHVKTAHNGFIEVYLDGGFVGWIFFAIFLLAMLKHGYDAINDRASPVSLPLIFCIVGLVSNNSESSFFRMDMLWFTLLLFTTKYSPSLRNIQWPSRNRRPTMSTSIRRPVVANGTAARGMRGVGAKVSSPSIRNFVGEGEAFA